MFMDMCIYVSILNMHFCIQLYWYSSSSSLNSLGILVHLFGSLGNWNIRNVSMNFLELWRPGELRQEEERTSAKYQRATARKRLEYLFSVSLWNHYDGKSSTENHSFYQLFCSRFQLLHSPFPSVVMASCCDYLLGYLLNFVVPVPCPYIAKYVLIKL